MIYKLNGQPFDINAEHLINEVNYPSNWFQDSANRLAMGITEEAEPAPTQAEILAQAQATFTSIVQNYLDSTAQGRGYDNVVSVCSYAGAPNPFQAEGIKFVEWRGNVWATCYSVMNDVLAGTRGIPTEVELLALLPTLV